MTRLLVVCLGGAAGTAARYLLSLWITQKAASEFPWGTVAVNVIGCFVMGFVVQFAAANPMSETTKLALTTGVLGGFTTYSAFNQETLRLAQAGAWATSAANVGVTLAGCLVAGILGVAAARTLS